MRLFRALPLILPCAVAIACSSSPNVSSSDGGTPESGSPITDAGGADGSASVDGGSDGGAIDPGLGWTSGTRLRAIVQTSGTARVFQGWRDVMLSVDCSYALASDKKRRCIPSTGGNNLFDDDKCASQVVDVAQGGTAPKYVAAPANAPAPACDAGPDVYGLGASIATPAALWSWDGANCVSTGQAGDATHTYHHVGAKVAPASFVGETDAIEPRGARISARVWVGDDGSRQDGELLDTKRSSAACSATESQYESGQYYCVPRALAFLEDFFSESMCMTAAAFYPSYSGACTAPPTAIQDSTLASIGKPVTLFEPGAALKGQIYRGTPAACNTFQTPAMTSTSFYAPGAALPLTSLLAFAMKNEGTGRMLDTIGRTESGAFGVVIGFYDSMKSTACSKQKANDGQDRCVPRTNYVVNQFSDDKCSQAIVEIPAGGTPPPAGTFLVTSVPLAQPGTYGEATFQIGAKGAVPAMTWEWNGSMCVMSGVNAASDYYTTTAIPPTDLATVTTAPE